MLVRQPLRTSAARQYLVLQSDLLPRVLTLTGLEWDRTGQTPGCDYAVSFRVAEYGLHYPDAWTPYSASALQAASAQLRAGRLRRVQVRFTQAGTGALALHELRILGTCTPVVPLPEPQASHYLAKDVYGTSRHEHLALALLEKMYRPGQLPPHLVRGEGQGATPELEDADFLDLWMTHCRFVALLILHSRRLGRLATDPELLHAYLEQRGLHPRPGANGQHLAELRALSADLPAAARERGTPAVFTPTGEFSRLIGRSPYTPRPALHAALLPAGLTGWVLGTSGAGYAGTAGLPPVWLRYGGAATLALAPSGQLPVAPAQRGVSVLLSSAAGVPVLALAPTSLLAAALGGLGLAAAGTPGAPEAGLLGLDIDAGIDYEVLWLVRQPDPAASTALTLHLYNAAGYAVAGRRTDGTGTSAVVVEGPFPDRWTWVRTILWNSRRDPATLASPEHQRTNLGTGCQYQAPASAWRVQPGAQAPAQDQGPGAGPALLVRDVLVRPLVLGTTLAPLPTPAAVTGSGGFGEAGPASGPRPASFLGCGAILNVWYRNQNPALDAADIYRIARHDLTPSDTFLLLHAAE